MGEDAEAMRCDDEASWYAEQWDDYLHEFGLAAYVEARYGLQRNDLTHDDQALDFHVKAW
jgi:hypothetical protein